VTAREVVVEMLRGGASDRAISRETGISRDIIARTRCDLGIDPLPDNGRAGSTPEELFAQRTEDAGEGHVRWTGWHTGHGTPAVRWRGRLLTAYRIAFALQHGRLPDGRVAPTCGESWCVAPGHVQDQTQRAQYAAIFG